MHERATVWSVGLDRGLSWAMLGIYGAIIAALTPDMIIARSDDFGYLESTIRTFQTHWPETGNWLTAGNTLFAILTALAYWATGNFYVSTFGVLVVFALGAFGLLSLLLKQWAPLSPPARYLVAFTVVTSPVYLNKSVDFAGAVPAWFFFLLALVFYGRKAYLGFFLSVIAGSMIRQNAVALLVLPAADLLLAYHEDRRLAARLLWRLVPGLVAVAAITLLSKMVGEVNYAQAKITSRVLEAFSAKAFTKNLTIGLIVALSSFVFFRALLDAAPRRNSLRQRLAADRAAFVTLGVLAGIWLLLFARLAIHFELEPVPLFQLAGRGGMLALLALAAIAIGLRRRISVPWSSPLIPTQLAYIALPALLGIWWDYYFFEIVLLSVLLACESLYKNQSRFDRVKLSRRSVAIFGAILMCNTACGLYLKFQLERYAATIVVLETMMRNHEIAPEELKVVPFGYKGWMLFEPWVAKNWGREFPLGDVLSPALQFITDLDGANVDVRWSSSYRKVERDGCSILRSGKAVLVGFPYYYVVTRCGPRLPQIGALNANERTFPLNNQEWDAYIRRPSRSAGQQ
jgi:hypothetical protein